MVMDGSRPRVIVIAGPTGVGKTAVAVALARRLGIEVISADSRQVYRGMDVATGKPTFEERRAVAHHLIDVVNPDDQYQAARFRNDAALAIGAIQSRGRLPVVVGGTGLYIRALLRGLDPAPPADLEFRRELTAVSAREGRGSLHARLASAAPTVASRLHPHDDVRVIRALEKLRGGHSAEGHAWSAFEHGGNAVFIGLTMARGALGARLEARAAAMARAGLAEEVEALLARGYAPTLSAMQGIGYREFARVVRGDLTEAEAIRLMQRDTVRYAKRQQTWFAREPGIEWLDVTDDGDVDRIAARIEQRAMGAWEGEAH